MKQFFLNFFSKKKKAEQPLLASDFTDAVSSIMYDLEEDFFDNGKSTLVVSDVLDKDGHQYVNLVQEGGAVLGIALVGYTYILEQMGIRFLKLAGTSAGAINTALLSSIGGKEDKKSIKILEELAKKNLFDFVDGHWFAKYFIAKVIGNNNYMKRIGTSLLWLVSFALGLGYFSNILLWENSILAFLLAFFLLIILGVVYKMGGKRDTDLSKTVSAVGKYLIIVLFLSSALQLDALQVYTRQIELGFLLIITSILIWKAKQMVASIHWIMLSICIFSIIWSASTLYFDNKTFFVDFGILSLTAIAIFNFMALFLGATLIFFFDRFKRSGYGINKGDNLLNWVKRIMADNGIHNLSDLDEKITTTPALILRDAITGNLEGLDNFKTLYNLEDEGLAKRKDAYPMTLIASEITTGNKIEFPKMYHLYRTKENNDIHPAEFVRASMSIPVFFEAYQIQDIETNNKVIKNAWVNFFKYRGTIPNKVIFVDGGILSNFPINIFYNPKVKTPRLPTFGIRLKSDEKSQNHDGFPKLQDYFAAIFNTTRHYYDKDFLIKSDDFRRTIGEIDVMDFNWLNFSMTNEEKIALFKRGAEAANMFLRGFDWERYKKYREDMYKELMEG